MEKLTVEQAGELRAKLQSVDHVLCELFFQADACTDLESYLDNLRKAVSKVIGDIELHTEEPYKVFGLEVTETKRYSVRVRARNEEEARECFENNEFVLNAMEADDHEIEITEIEEYYDPTNSERYNLNAEEAE